MFLKSLLLSVLLLTGLTSSAWATPPVKATEDLFLPNLPLRTLQAGSRQPVYIQISPQNHAQVLKHYLALSQTPDWHLDFPSETEAQIWIETLKKTGKTPVFILSLSHLKSKLNAHLTIGALPETRELRGQTIITIYTTPYRFGRSGR
ncbi:hypothetical protein COW36_00955 [bacterium (Candidatus Blackallbacteria) CG17_big_fil_post_rev_8_21_14_2_50_48_46]|uniref:Uncharacterized protein n=1 Tax=bacterium (Candidatus Blackallbacteria) CG17_big_fil_post_rev_8_21_14_2_50_48_46 TaxID=2014261 RepID=A0A2M7GBA1_9BACT|nr:MAG: hypothetical protein COW64_10220 [bacterium (Candidatus Blackallbacteria) CG18_big_fil_WC_8_21_14_2_50_49_26]PIW19437.1 MAG: hypothetical protein COW36_00955 [bacterium (Candidatus Blackallbacteria) CG17_big_fil_post_rev_8_21_14_2_50_48_46]PIW48959.1 MAG: hypothetical protein COW20_07500 [bacterium (Candidatus Blackallbacteria) CG13_big_fil_rev_8_21_14_2_50_49_14]